MEFSGWLLDADYITVEDSPVIRLWITQEDRTVVGYYKGFEPYFYAVPKSGELINDLRATLTDLETERYNKTISFKEVKQTKKFDFGREIDVIKLTAYHPQHVPSLRKAVSELSTISEVREAKIPFANRFLIDEGLVPLAGINVHGQEIDFNENIQNTEIKVNKFEKVEKKQEPPLSKLAFDCEMYNEGGRPNSSNHPIVIIGYITDKGKDVECLVSEDKSDKELIKKFVKKLKKLDPDVLLTFNGDDFDWPYLRDRAEQHGINLKLSRDGRTPTWRGGSRKKVSLNGRLNVDLYRIAERDVGDVKMMSLEEVSDHLGVLDKADRTNVPGTKIGRYWEDKKKREELLEYAKDDVRSTFGVGNELLPTQIELSKMSRQFLDEVSKMGRGRQVEWFLMSEAYDRGELFPNKGNYGKRSEKSYLGGFVLEPKRGLHENVVSLDFSSMYPSLMVSYNISPDTLIEDDEASELKEEDYYEAPEVGHKFRKSPDGFFREILQDLIKRRNQIKQKIDERELEKDKRLLNIRQKAIKTLTNSFYGYTGWNAARWYKKECAEATTAWGRKMIKEAIKKAENQGFKVIYGDTDSIFIKKDGIGENKIEKQSKDLAQSLNDELPLNIEIEDVYKTIFFTEKKKRYAGLNLDNEIYIRGLEVRRGDWCKLAKKIQKKVIEIILKDKNPDKAVNVIKDTINDLRNGEIPLEDLVIRKTLKKKISNYKSKQAHVRAAEKAKEKGYKIDPGGMVSFIVIKRGGENVGDRSYPIEMIKDFSNNIIEFKDKTGKYKIDQKYYIDKQVIPAVNRILNYFGYTENQLKGKPEQKTFEDF
ncbi:MAG: DNA polymerase PolB3 [Candidatus Methanohalarchaeum thermophilum]|uniref:DNA polymerase n=1 Tax=Methanohalarchaeum thermophilum TaxID=1903181 RepID=A0A1Q6DV44_METT1|nr:MAG: DNA polymerase PolB3 [Candidatus Methanohalarchaeum thermophilum]